MPLQERERLQVVNRFLKLEISKEKELENIVRLAAEVCHVPIALITILDEEHVYFKYKVGTDLDQSKREVSFCSYAIQQNMVMEVPDAKLDERFLNNPLVTMPGGLRFYAGAPLTTHDGHNIGTLCVFDREPKQLTPHQKQMLHILSRQIIQIMEFELSLKVLKDQFIEARKSEIKLRSFFESSQSGHVLIGSELHVLAYNKVFEDFIALMYDVKVQVGTLVTDYIDKAYVNDFVNNFNQALAGIPVQHERMLEFKHAGTLWCHFSYAPALDNDGGIIGISFNVNNITERKRHEKQILEQNEALRKIAHFQSHKLRKPVASILGLMNIVKLDGYGHNEETLTMMEVAVKELDDVIRNIVSTTQLIHPNESIDIDLFPTSLTTN